jgi:hypothetical protein
MGVSRATKEKRREPGSLQRITRKAKGKEYPYWRWRTYRRGDLGWERVDLVLGERLTGLRTRLYVALGRVSAPLLLERWMRLYLKPWDELPTWTGQVAGSKQRAAWWLEIPRQPGDPVKLCFRKLNDGTYDFRRARTAIKEAEDHATTIYSCLTDDPVLELARLLWLEREGQRVVGEIAEQQLELRRLRRAGELNQRDYEADERDSYRRLDDWENMVSTVQRRHDEQLAALIEAAARPERDQIQREVLNRVDRYLNDSRQQQRWRSDHWDGTTLQW